MVVAAANIDDVFAKPVPVVEYVPTFRFEGDFIDDAHRSFGEAPVDGVKIVHEVRGSLRRADAAKIYELAYFSEGDTLDLGTNWGLSAFVAASALAGAGTGFRVTTVDLEPKMTQRARERLGQLKIANVDFETGDATKFVLETGKRFGFAFVDHSHAYEHVEPVCRALGDLLMPGAFAAFHDFADRRNLDPLDPDFRVLQAVRDGLDERFNFVGVYGCMGLYRFVP